MGRWLLVASLAMVLSACGGSSGAASPPTSASPVTSCDGLARTTCDGEVQVALAAVAASGWTPTHVRIGSSVLCPGVGCLFDPDGLFPYPDPPVGGRWLGSAEVAFAQTDQHAGLNIALVGSELQAVLIGYRAPLPRWCSGACPSDSTTDGPFRLELVLPRLDWMTGDAITGEAILSFAGSVPTIVYGSGSGVIGFSYAEVGGSRKVDPIWTSDCGSHPLDPATPINEDLAKSGAIEGSGPEADFVRTFLEGPDVRLPAGTWDITALAQLSQHADCSGGPNEMRATVRITVGS